VFTHDHETPWAYLEMGDKGRPVARPVGEETVPVDSRRP